MRPADIEALQTLGRPTVHPDGTRAVVAVSHPDLDADAVVGQLWEVPLGGSVPRRLTLGTRDTAPRFSPDGRLLAFLRPAEGAPQLHLIDARGGEAVRITEQPLGVGAFTWSPDSGTIVYTARVAEPGRYGTLDGVDAAAEPARRFTTLRFRANGLGYTTDRRAQLFAVEVPPVDAEPRYDRVARVGEETPAPVRVPESVQLTDADTDHRTPVITPDGRAVLFTAALHETRDVDLCDDVWQLPLDRTAADAAPVRRTPDTNLAVADLAIGPDGRVWFLAQDLGDRRDDFVARNTALYLIDGDAVRRLTDPEAHDFGEVGAAITVVDAERVLVQDRTRGSGPLRSITADGRVETLVDGEVDITGHDAAGGATVAVIATPESAGELALVAEHGIRVLTDFGAAARATGLVRPVEFTAEGRDGTPVHGWVAIPPGEGPHPVLLNIHGGPFASYGVHLFDETQVHVEAGYAVVYCNPRGSAGYGEAHGRVIKGAMGTVDLHDVLDFLDGAVAAHPQLDGQRVGVMGGSYGGYLTAWTIAHDHRFAGAIVERGFLDPEAFIGTSDIGSFFSAAYTGDDPAQRLTQSPQAVVDQVRTPTLVLHSELDLRCPVGQAERYYTALKQHGVETEMVLFPGEDHELSRSGRPRHRLQRFEIILDWWARHLPIERTGAPE